MTRKDYETIAAAIRKVNEQQKQYETQFVTLPAIRETAEAIADELGYENPRFDRQKFLAACTA